MIILKTVLPEEPEVHLHLHLDDPFAKLLEEAASAYRHKTSRIEDIRLICMGRDCPAWGMEEAQMFPIRHPCLSDRTKAVVDGTVFHVVFRRPKKAARGNVIDRTTTQQE